MYALEDSNRDDWLLTLQTHQVPHKQIELYADCFTIEEWNAISSNQELTEEFILKFRAELNWTMISKYQMLSENFIYTMKDRINFKELGSHNYIDVKFMEKYGFRNYSQNYLMTFKHWNVDEVEYISNILKEIVCRNGGVQAVIRIDGETLNATEDDVFHSFIRTLSDTVVNFNSIQTKLPFNFPYKMYDSKVSETYQQRLKTNIGILKEMYDIWA